MGHSLEETKQPWAIVPSVPNVYECSSNNVKCLHCCVARIEFMYIGFWSFHHLYFRLFASPSLISDHYTTDFYSSGTERFWDKLFGATGMLTCVSKPCVLGDVNNRKAVWLASLSWSNWTIENSRSSCCVPFSLRNIMHGSLLGKHLRSHLCQQTLSGQ